MAVNLPENLVSVPPIQEPLLVNGVLNFAWARWFESLYMRTSYKGGNAIDQTAAVVDDDSDRIDQNTSDIISNANAITANSDNIAANTSAIAANTSALVDIEADTDQLILDVIDLEATTDALALDILENQGRISNSRKRIFGDNEPPEYDDTSTSYFRGDYVVLGVLGSGGDYYYRAATDIAAPAGAFTPALWDKVALNAGLLLSDYLEYSPIRALSLSFQGRTTNGAVTPAHSYNLASLNRVSVGVYEGSLSQATCWGASITAKVTPLFQVQVSASASTSFFTADYEDLGAGAFRISVYEVTKGAGSDLVKTLYDHATAGDRVMLAVLADINTGVLPPP